MKKESAFKGLVGKCMGVALALSMLLTAGPALANEGLNINTVSTTQGAGLFWSSQDKPKQTGEVVALDDLNISITVDEYTSIVQENDFVYVYTKLDGYVPYVIIGYYDMTVSKMASTFTSYMKGEYPDLKVTELNEKLSLGDKNCIKAAFEYKVNGYTFVDTRYFVEIGKYTYMFGSKEVPGSDDLIPEGYLEGIVKSAAMLAGGYSDYALHVDKDKGLQGSQPVSTSTEKQEPKQQDPEPKNEPKTPEPQEPEPTDEGMIIFEEARAGYEGAWVTFGDGFQLYVPKNWVEVEITDEELQQGVLYFAYEPDRLADPPFVEVDFFYNSDGFTTVEEIANGLASVGCEVEGVLNVNGMHVASYENTSNDIGGIMFFHPETTDYIIVVLTGSYSVNYPVDATILCSLSPLE
ncbi:MAG: hypothetical protein IKE43_10005 [Coriobacteriales bacterium]|nr:hypothetical protein [Coriobacteriales bacterium]